ncbi:MAG TPA: hypothetical protein PK447_01520 [Ignavibacteria bacterium]|nr:hypothetical protein [Ignavibacteria bacterium]
MSRLQKKIIAAGILLTLTIVLFILKIVITPKPADEQYAGIKKENLIKKSVFKNDEAAEIKYIYSRIDSVLYGFGIKKDWIQQAAKQTQKDKNKKSNPDGNKYVYIPKDISVPEIIADINYYVQVEDVNFSAEEEFETGNTKLTVSGLKTNYFVNFYYDENLKRDDDKICLIINKLNDYKPEDISKVLSSQYAYSVVMPLSLDRLDLQAAVIDSKKDYILYPEIGRTEDYESDIRKDKDWISKVYSLCTDYDKNKAIIFSNPHNALDFEKEFIDELTKCRGYVFRDTVFTKVSDSQIKDKKISGVLKELILQSRNRSSNPRIYLISVPPASFGDFIKTVADMEKSGIKFLTFSQFMKKQNG